MDERLEGDGQSLSQVADWKAVGGGAQGMYCFVGAAAGKSRAHIEASHHIEHHLHLSSSGCVGDFVAYARTPNPGARACHDAVGS